MLGKSVVPKEEREAVAETMSRISPPRLHRRRERATASQGAGVNGLK
jgi:hypothetical protein